MPSFRCPKCRTRLTADGSTPTVNCDQCGQLCAIPEMPAVAAPPKALAPPPLPLARKEPTEGVLRMEDIMAPQADDVIDVVEAADDHVMDVVEGDRPKKKKKKRPLNIKKPIWYDSDRSNPLSSNIQAYLFYGCLGTGGLALLFTLSGILVPVLAMFAAIMAAMVIALSVVWLLILATEDGFVVVMLLLCVPIYRLYWLLNNWERVGIPFLIELAGWFVLVIATAVMGKF